MYWRPVWHVLSDGEFQLILANAAHVKNVPGRKTDVSDAAWLAELLAHGLIRASFVPDGQTQELRDLLRTRKRNVDEVLPSRPPLQCRRRRDLIPGNSYTRAPRPSGPIGDSQGRSKVPQSNSGSGLMHQGVVDLVPAALQHSIGFVRSGSAPPVANSGRGPATSKSPTPAPIPTSSGRSRRRGRVRNRHPRHFAHARASKFLRRGFRCRQSDV